MHDAVVLTLAGGLLVLSVIGGIVAAVFGIVELYRDRHAPEPASDPARVLVEVITRDIEIIRLPEPATRREARVPVVDRVVIWEGK